MAEDLNKILERLKAGENPTLGVDSASMGASSQNDRGTLRKDFGFHAMSESGNDNEAP